jgi:ABC-2 type transport system permease protein
VISIAFIATALNSLASTAFTREGRHLELLKFIPVPYETQMYAKAMVRFMFTYPMLLITDIIICIYVKTDILTGAMYAILMLLAHIISIAVGMMLDSASPYTEWDDEYSALRGNLNVFFNMAIMMILAVAALLLGLLLYDVIKLPILIYYIVIFIILAVSAERLVVIAPKRIVANMEKL